MAEPKSPEERLPQGAAARYFVGVLDWFPAAVTSFVKHGGPRPLCEDPPGGSCVHRGLIRAEEWGGEPRDRYFTGWGFENPSG